MKLLNKTNVYFLAAYLVVFCLGGILFFFLFQVIIDNDLTNKLHERKNYIIKQLARSDSLIIYQRLSANTLSVSQSSGALTTAEVVSDTVIFDDVEHKMVGYRQLSFGTSSQGRNYNVHIRRALVERKDLIKGVVLLEILLFLAFVAVLTLMNNLLSKRIWKHFYVILDKINSYKIDRGESLQFPGTNDKVTEFDELAICLEKMSAKITQEFNIQKEFIENASHEIQTPLAIIKNKMEELLQSPELTEKQMNSISTASLAANRLSKLNEALLILSRIENRQFHEVKDICINDLIELHLRNFDELLKMKGIRVVLQFDNRIHTKINPFLADMLLENLITNAIKHNSSQGAISVCTKGDRMIITNLGDDPRTDTMKFFDRFAKSNQKSASLGLGLPIVKAICDLYMFPIKYEFENYLHKISLQFNTLESLQN